MAYTIAAAIESKMFDEVYVSTDSAVYAEIAKHFGASVPFLRSEKNAGDKASSWDVVREALDQYSKRDCEFDTVCLLQPTSPMRRTQDIINGYVLMAEKNANAVVSVCETDHSPLWCNTLPESLSMKDFISAEVLDKPRQAIPNYYRVNGALYIVKTNTISNNIYNLYDNKCYAYIMDKKYSIDIDDEWDFQIAQILMGQSIQGKI